MNDHYLGPLSEFVYQYLTAMVSRRSCFNRNGLATGQSLTGMV